MRKEEAMKRKKKKKDEWPVGQGLKDFFDKTSGKKKRQDLEINKEMTR